MFDIGISEMAMIAIVAIVVIGPKDLPLAMRTVGRWTAKARGMMRHFQSGLEAMAREAELEEMEKRWKSENERIMREHADAAPAAATPALPAPMEPLPAAAQPASTTTPSADDGPARP